MRLMVILAGLAATALFATGCGGSSDSASLSKAEYTKQADAICKQALKNARSEYTTLSKKAENEKKPKTAKELTEEILIDYYGTKANELRTLTPPEADEAEITAMLAALDKVVAEGKKDGEVLIAGSKTIDKERKIAREYGLKACAEV